MRKEQEYQDRREIEQREYEEQSEKDRQDREDFWRKSNMKFEAELLKSLRQS